MCGQYAFSASYALSVEISHEAITTATKGFYLYEMRSI